MLERDVDRRVNAVVELTAAANESDAAEERAREAKASHERAWAAAIGSGWTEKDLRATGARAPGVAPRRTRKPRGAQQPTEPPFTPGRDQNE